MAENGKHYIDLRLILLHLRRNGMDDNWLIDRKINPAEINSVIEKKRDKINEATIKILANGFNFDKRARYAFSNANNISGGYSAIGLEEIFKPGGNALPEYVKEITPPVKKEARAKEKIILTNKPIGDEPVYTVWDVHIPRRDPDKKIGEDDIDPDLLPVPENQNIDDPDKMAEILKRSASDLDAGHDESVPDKKELLTPEEIKVAVDSAILQLKYDFYLMMPELIRLKGKSYEELSAGLDYRPNYSLREALKKRNVMHKDRVKKLCRLLELDEAQTAIVFSSWQETNKQEILRLDRFVARKEKEIETKRQAAGNGLSEFTLRKLLFHLKYCVGVSDSWLAKREIPDAEISKFNDIIVGSRGRLKTATIDQICFSMAMNSFSVMVMTTANEYGVYRGKKSLTIDDVFNGLDKIVAPPPLPIIRKVDSMTPAEALSTCGNRANSWKPATIEEVFKNPYQLTFWSWVVHVINFKDLGIGSVGKLLGRRPSYIYTVKRARSIVDKKTIDDLAEILCDTKEEEKIYYQYWKLFVEIYGPAKKRPGNHRRLTERIKNGGTQLSA